MSAGSVATAYVRLRPDAKGFAQEAQVQLSPELQAIQNRIAATRAEADALASRASANSAARAASTEAEGTALVGLAAKASIVAGALYEVKQAFDAASSREANLDLVSQSVENAGQSWSLYGKQVTDALDAQRAATGFSLPEITESFARLEQAVKDPAKALQELATAENVARGQGKDLAQVTSSITQALQGQYSNLNQLGTVVHQQTTAVDALRTAHAELLDSGEQLTAVEQAQYQAHLQAATAADKQATADQALAELQQRNAGQAQTYISSTSGSVAQLRTSLTQVQEQIGGTLLPIVGTFAQAANGAIQGYLRYSNLFSSSLHSVTTLFDSATSSAQDFGQAVAQSQTAGTRTAGLNRLVPLIRELGQAADTAGHLGKNSSDVFSEGLQKLARENPSLERQITDLDGIARAAGGLKNLSDIDIKVTLSAPDVSAFTAKIVAQVQRGLDATAFKAASDFNASIASGLNSGNFTQDFGLHPASAAPDARGGASDDKIKAVAKKNAVTYSQQFVQTIDASGIGTALTDALTQAQAQLVSESGTLASTIGQALDAKLKAQTLPATREISRLQQEIAASQASVSARDTGQAVADAQKQLADLQRIYGSGALTGDQAQQIAQARVALADAQDQVGNDAKQAQISRLQTGVDAATAANDAAKTAASKRLADLSAELNDGLITQKQYVTRLNALLKAEGVNYKNTGKLLGQAVADGFRDGLSSILAQASILGALGKGTLKGAARGTKAIDPAKAEADAIKAFVDQAAGAGGKFNVSGAGSLPPGVTLASLLGKAAAQRSGAAYTTRSDQKADTSLAYAGATRDHTAQTVAELKRLNSKPIVVNVTVDGKKTKRKTAEATRS